jgi:hypothetical protein
MSSRLTSFEGMSMKVVAVRTVDNSDFGFEFPASGPQSTPSTLTTPLEQPSQHRDRPAQDQGWYHGGINE